MSNVKYKMDFYSTFNGKKYTSTSFSTPFYSRWGITGNSDVNYNSAINNAVSDYYRHLDDGNNKKDLIYSVSEEEVKNFIDIAYKDYFYENDESRHESELVQKAIMSAINSKEKFDIAIANQKHTSSWNTHHIVNSLRCYAVSKTTEYAKFVEDFNKWKKRRSGVVETFNTLYPGEELTLQKYCWVYNQNDFRTALENARPRDIIVGTLVSLKPEFINVYRKDPFYWERDVKDQPRIGIVTELVEGSYARSVGSRVLKIQWCATQSESSVMEKMVNIETGQSVSGS